MSGLDQFEQAFADLMAEYDFNMGHGETHMDVIAASEILKLEKRLLKLEAATAKPPDDKMFRLPPELEEEWRRRLGDLEKKTDRPHWRLEELERRVAELERGK